MKEEDVVDEIEPNTFSTLSKQKRAGMSKCFKELALFCSIYDVFLRHLAVQQELFVGGDLSRNVVFVLADAPFNVQRGLEDDHAEYDVCGSSDVKNMTIVLEEVMKSGAHWDIFASLFLVFSLVQGLASVKKKESEPIPGSILARTDLRVRTARV